MSERFDGDGAVPCLSGILARQRARQPAPTPHNFQCSPLHVFFRADRNTHHRHLTFVCDAFNAFNERNFLRRRGVLFRWQCHCFGGVDQIPMSSSSRRGKANALTVLAVIPVRPGETSSMYATVSTPFPWNSRLNRFCPGRNARKNIAGPMGSPCWTPV